MAPKLATFFRLVYPEVDRPVLQIGKRLCEIVDLSEEGVKFVQPAGFSPALETLLNGIVKFYNGETVSISGKVLRYDEKKGHCVLHLHEGLPFAKMIEEQRRLINKYKK